MKQAAEELARMPPLVFAGECRNLQARLAKCAVGESFWLQGLGSGFEDSYLTLEA